MAKRIGSIYKELTKARKPPKNIEEIDKNVHKNYKYNDYGNSVTLSRGNIFSTNSYSTDIDEYLK